MSYLKVLWCKEQLVVVFAWKLVSSSLVLGTPTCMRALLWKIKPKVVVEK
jgi:hypothetical protein